MNFKRLLNTSIGITVISIVLGLGLATIFRKVCTDKNCITFKGPVITDIKDKIYKFDDKCYKYNIEPAVCDNKKQIVDIKSPNEIDNFQPNISSSSNSLSISNF